MTIYEQIKALPDYEGMYFNKDTTKPVEVDCGHEHAGFDTDDLKKYVSTLVSGSNYTANDDTFPSEVVFANGRKVGIAFDGDKPYLTIGTEQQNG